MEKFSLRRSSGFVIVHTRVHKRNTIVLSNADIYKSVRILPANGTIKRSLTLAQTGNRTPVGPS